mgnify:CR=1 FL=1
MDKDDEFVIDFNEIFIEFNKEYNSKIDIKELYDFFQYLEKIGYSMFLSSELNKLIKKNIEQSNFINEYINNLDYIKERTSSLEELELSLKEQFNIVKKYEEILKNKIKEYNDGIDLNEKSFKELEVSGKEAKEILNNLKKLDVDTMLTVELKKEETPS